MFPDIRDWRPWLVPFIIVSPWTSCAHQKKNFRVSRSSFPTFRASGRWECSMRMLILLSVTYLSIYLHSPFPVTFSCAHHWLLRSFADGGSVTTHKVYSHLPSLTIGPISLRFPYRQLLSVRTPIPRRNDLTNVQYSGLLPLLTLIIHAGCAQRISLQLIHVPL